MLIQKMQYPGAKMISFSQSPFHRISSYAFLHTGSSLELILTRENAISCTSLTPGSPSAHPTPALVAHTQGGLTLSLEEGELDADFCKLGGSRPLNLLQLISGL